jgi:hypothetical protein
MRVTPSLSKTPSSRKWPLGSLFLNSVDASDHGRPLTGGGVGGGMDSPSVRHGDREPHAALVREICTDVYKRLAVIARTQNAQDVKEAGVVLTVALDSFRGVRRSGSLVNSAKLPGAGTGVPRMSMGMEREELGNANNKEAEIDLDVADRKPIEHRTSFDRAMHTRMADLVERNDHASVARVRATNINAFPRHPISHCRLCVW